jgi:hypothetical protein
MSEYLSPYDDDHVPVYVLNRSVYVERTAAPWIRCVLAPTGVTALVIGLHDDEWGTWVLSGIASGAVSMDDVKQTAYDLLGDVSPYKWWKTARLLALSSRDDIAGHLTLSGLSPWNLTVAQWVTAVYALLTKGADVKAKFKIDAPLDDPPAGIVDDEWMSDAAFAAMVAQARNAPGQK